MTELIIAIAIVLLIAWSLAAARLAGDADEKAGRK